MPIARANGVFRAVAVEAGRHRVEFDYAPSELRIGGIISLASGTCLLAAWWFARRERRPLSGARGPGAH